LSIIVLNEYIFFYLNRVLLLVWYRVIWWPCSLYLDRYPLPKNLIIYQCPLKGVPIRRSRHTLNRFLMYSIINTKWALSIKPTMKFPVSCRRLKPNRLPQSTHNRNIIQTIYSATFCKLLLLYESFKWRISMYIK